MKKILILLCCLYCYFLMAQQTVINYNYLNIKDKNTNEIISSRFVSTVLKWEESNNDYTIIKTGDSNTVLNKNY